MITSIIGTLGSYESNLFKKEGIRENISVDVLNIPTTSGFHAIVGRENTGKTYLSHRLRDQFGFSYIGIDEPDEDLYSLDDLGFMKHISKKYDDNIRKIVINSFKNRMYLFDRSENEGFTEGGVRAGLFLGLTALSIHCRRLGLVLFGVFPLPPKNSDEFLARISQCTNSLWFTVHKGGVIVTSRNFNNREKYSISL